MWKILIFTVVLLVSIQDAEGWLFRTKHVHHHHHIYNDHHHHHHHHHGWGHHGRRSMNDKKRKADEKDIEENDERKLME
uniref:Histidine-rich glycoprotein n=1 Tax=Magallana gigas TaxID=29159 RepID=A0A8W8HNS2_MAGGI|nr:nickel/cobalt efflux system RcnA [Crassostrea gigas]